MTTLQIYEYAKKAILAEWEISSANYMSDPTNSQFQKANAESWNKVMQIERLIEKENSVGGSK